MTTYRVGICVGRFQPFHRCHLSEVILPALDQVDSLILLLGSSQRPRTPKDPFTDDARGEMLRLGLSDAGLGPTPVDNFAFYLNNGKRVYIVPLRDSMYSNAQWQMNVQERVRNVVNELKTEFPTDTNVEISLFGVDRDESTFYLDFFPQWKNKTLVRDGTQDVVNGTMCREYLFQYPVQPEKWLHMLSPSVGKFIQGWLKTPAYQQIKEEFEFLKNYREEMSKFKYPIVFQTADNIILWKGHILLANRRSFPGKGLWCLPGGFINPQKTLQQSAIDNAKEKTKIQIKPEWLVSSKTFDAPKRSLRGRTITTVFLWKLPDTYSFDVEPGKNTNKVKWFEFAEAIQMSGSLYEDHYDIILDLLSTVK